MSHNLNIEGLPEGTFRIFYGGEDEGISLQITIESKYVQLNFAQTSDLVHRIMANIDVTKAIKSKYSPVKS